MLAGTASLLQQAPAGIRASPSPAIPLQALDDKFRQMAAIFELASRETLVRKKHIQPLSCIPTIAGGMQSSQITGRHASPTAVSW